ncbi:MAG: phospho-sugar mutase [Micrococcales bacterium]|nr:phospho-sugar mutase [Micrococcales bacterium]
MSSLETLIAKARSWQSQDPDAETKAELEALILAGNEQGLTDRFGARLGFGTAGLRGELGAGPNRMNRVLVAQAAVGIARYLKANFDDPSCVIGFDARKNSDVFAKDSAEILVGLGVRAYLYDSLVATPMVAFAVRELGCSAGIMVTASHNPPADNGYKVFDFTGSQIIPPMDALIASEIGKFAENELVGDLVRSSEYSSVPASISVDYLQGVSGLMNRHSDRKSLKIVYSAMHGVGAEFIEKIFDLAGMDPLIPVASQHKPDGTFPTVAFPNPEEPGAMDKSIETAKASGADLVLANDPDADRLCVAYKDSTGNYIQLSGDDLGLLLAEELAGRAKREGVSGTLACSIVSSSAIEKIAEHYGLEFAQTLTGFKWVGRVPNLIFGYEEALGYCVDSKRVKDKDGLSAALVVADIATTLAASGYTIGDQLEKLGARDGYFATDQISIRVKDLSIIENLMKKLRANPIQELDGQAIVFTDYLNGWGNLPGTDAIQLDLSDGRRVIVRPSGTEPKLKCYLLAVSDQGPKSQSMLASLKAAMQKVLD